jgi:hypothetical protein
MKWKKGMVQSRIIFQRDGGLMQQANKSCGIAIFPSGNEEPGAWHYSPGMPKMIPFW